MIDVALRVERDPMDAALDLLMQKVERRIIAKHNYDTAPSGSALEHAAQDLALANQDLRNSATNYNNTVREQLEQLLSARPCTLRELLEGLGSGEAERHAQVIEENNPRALA